YPRLERGTFVSCPAMPHWRPVAKRGRGDAFCHPSLKGRIGGLVGRTQRCALRLFLDAGVVLLRQVWPATIGCLVFGGFGGADPRPDGQVDDRYVAMCAFALGFLAAQSHHGKNDFVAISDFAFVCQPFEAAVDRLLARSFGAIYRLRRPL